MVSLKGGSTMLTLGVEYIVFGLAPSTQHAKDQLNDLAAQGWRVVATVGRDVIMCRPKPFEDKEG